MPALPTPEAWAQIRYEYEQTRRSVEDICFAYGITPNTLRRRGRRWGWQMRHPPLPDEGPEAVAPPALSDAESSNATDSWFLGLRLRGDEREEKPEPPLDDLCIEPSPHITAPPSPAADTRPIGERLQGAVGRVLPAIEATLAGLAAGPLRPRELEMAARALGSLTRTLRELNGLLGQHGANEPRRDTEELRRSLARKLEAIIAERDEETPRRYLAGWEAFAAEAKQAAAPVL